MKYLTCPYCEQKIRITTQIDDYAQCENHEGISILIWESLNIEISNSNYMIYLFKKERMELFKKTMAGLGCFFDDINLNLPFDPYLTPENFEDKIKLYLTFQ